MSLRRRLVAVLFALGCGRTLPAPAVTATASLLEQARARPVPARLQGRLTVRIRSHGEEVGGSTGGALILDRPGRGHVAVMGPLGGPLLTVQTDGTGAAVAVVRHRRHLAAADADRVVREASGGLVGVDDVLGLLVGDLPLDGPVAAERRLPDGDLEVTLGTPGGSRAVAVLDDPSGAPVSLVVTDAEGRTTLTASWQPFAPSEDGRWLLPTEVALVAPRLGLDVRLQHRSWTFPATVPEVFGLAPPEGFTTGPLELAATDALGTLVRELAGDPGGE